jgi:RNA polymerase sigma-70 factor (ECF subfamily)
VRDPLDAEDLALVEKFLAGDRRAFEALFDKYREKVYRIAFRFVRNREDALEVTQEVFLRVYQSLAKFKTDSKFFTWLYRVAVNRAIDFTRSSKARPARDLDQALLESQEFEAPGGRRVPDPAEMVEEKEFREKLAQAVNLLSEKHRTVFLLHAQENLSYKEIAQVAECSIGTVMSRLFYARRKLQELLAGMGLERPGKRTR